MGGRRACFEDEGYFRETYAITAERLAAIRRLPLVVLSAYMKRELLAAGIEAERVSVVPPFVHGLHPRAEPDGPPCVLFVGRLRPLVRWGDVAALARALREAVGTRAVAAPGLDRTSVTRRLIEVYEEVAVSARTSVARA